jgi:hypothetical protein
VSFFNVPRQTTVVALALSLGLHAGLGVWVKVRSANVERPEVAVRDVWAGRGIEIERTELEAAPLETTPSEATAADEAPAPVEPTVGVEACVADCLTPEAKPRSAEKARAEKPRATASVAARVTPPSTARTSVASASASVTAPSAASSGSSATAVSDPFGAVGLPAGVRFLPKAYTRALNQGSWRVAGFRTVSTGKLCEARVSIAVGEDRKLGPLEYADERERDQLPALCRTMLENGHRLVAAGEFSLDPKRVESGVMRLRVEIEVSDGPAHSDAEHDPNELFSESQEPPSPGKRGRSTFILNSGRRIDAFIDIE